ncbi:MAG: hypothetical protein HON90_02020 [Halobacteriovoraceae bacterium]|jgi:hypothetical protein|nr:hypothetical protein [Halobacteriovoraceae bacterium]
MSRYPATLVLSLIIVIISTNSAHACLEWGVPTIRGHLPLDDHFEEVSGADTSQFGKVFHISEAKKKLRLYITDKNGKDAQKVLIYKPGKNKVMLTEDIEDISVGSCFELKHEKLKQGNNSCIFMADIGGGKRKARNQIVITIVKDKMKYLSTEEALKVLTVRYPNGESYDAEAMAIHPVTGDIYILTKELYLDRDENHDDSFAKPAKLFKLNKHDWTNYSNGGDSTLNFIGLIDFSTISRKMKKDYLSQAVTAMDISSDGKKLVVSTYRDLFELHVDLAKVIGQEDLNQVLLNEKYTRIELSRSEENLSKSTRLLQQESIFYEQSLNKTNIYYSSEFKKTDFDYNISPLMAVECLSELY